MGAIKEELNNLHLIIVLRGIIGGINHRKPEFCRLSQTLLFGLELLIWKIIFSWRRRSDFQIASVVVRRFGLVSETLMRSE